MKVVEIWDFVSPDRIKSYYMRDGETIAFDNNKPYKMVNAVSSKFYMAGPCHAAMSDGSYFLALNEFDGVPPYDSDVDIVLYCNERVGLMNENYDKYSPNKIRKQFPNALMVGKIKEIPPHFNSGVHTLSPGESPHRQIRDERPQNRIKFFNECDYATVGGTEDSAFCDIPYFKELRKHLNKELIFIPGPINTNYLFDNYYSNSKSNSIFSYSPTVHGRRGDTLKFAKYIGKKYDLPVYTKPSNVGTLAGMNNMPGSDFLDLWTPHLYNFNLDPLDIQPGWHCKQVASVGSINIGGCNDAHEVLYPKTATCDWDILEEQFYKYHTDAEKRFNVINQAWESVNKIFSFDAIIKQFKERFV